MPRRRASRVLLSGVLRGVIEKCGNWRVWTLRLVWDRRPAGQKNSAEKGGNPSIRPRLHTRSVLNPLDRRGARPTRKFGI
jgi:hypothetical protein